MNSLVKELIQPLLEETTKTVAIFPGKFKPPHKGHFEVAKNLLDKADEIIVAISPVIVDGITPQQSKAVWELYNQLLGNKLKIEIVDKSPVKYTLDTIKENPNINFIPVFGKGEEDRYRSLVGKPNVEVYNGGNVEELNARDFRKMLATGQDFDKFLPVGINKDDFLNVFSNNVQEDMSQSDLASVEAYADKELAPIDIDFTKHFFDRLNDPRNAKPISPAELIGFFKRLARKKDKLETFLSQYREIVASDNRTNINIPLVTMSDKIIAKTIMRKKDFQSPDPKIELNELEDYEMKYWAMHADIYDALKKDPNKIYNFLKTKLTGEQLKALEYFYNEYFLKPEKLMENCGCMHTQQPMDFRSALASLTKNMMDQGLNITPLPKVKIINNDIENANNILGKTAYYDPNNCSITLYTLNRHPKDVLRSYSHEMIHRIQDNEGRLNNVNTTNTNEDSNLQELEKEAYLNGNIIFRNWEDSIKNQKYVKEYKEYALNELFEKYLPNIKKISKTSYIVGNGKDIEAEYYFRRIDIDNDIWAIGWSFTDNNQNTSPEAWKQVTATSFKVLNDFIKNKNPKQIEISGNTDSKTNIYKSPSFLKKLKTIFNNQYKIDNSPEYSVIMKLIEVLSQSSIQKRINTLNESYEQALDYWQNGDLNSKSKIERWNTIKRKIEREVLQEIYNIK